jgi:hypothetical protein
MHIRNALIAALALSAGTVSGQVVINEVWENPPGDGDIFDTALEYIELYGVPGTDLTGFAVALLKGGADFNNDNFAEAPPEIDEAFELDGFVIPASGFVVIYNDTAGLSDIPFLMPGGVASTGFVAAHIPATDTAGKLANGQSSSYILVRARANHSIVAGSSVYGVGYSFRKDINPDVNFDGKVDFGNEGGSARQVDPFQMIDDVAWSNAGGKEYVRSSEQEISDTPSFNPDGISRVNFFGSNPMLGQRVNSSGQIVPTRMADEEWIYGEHGPNDADLTYLIERLEGGNLVTVYGAPTDPNGDGFEDIDITGFAMTPGDFNDSVSAGITQFRFIRGDFNFDHVVDAADNALIVAELGQDLDRTTPCLDSMGNPNGFTCWYYEGREANGLMAMMNMDMTDGTGGANAPFVTQSDLDLWISEFGAAPCVGDIADDFGTIGADGQVSFGDFLALLGLIGPCAGGTPGCTGDIADDFGTVGGDGQVSFGDFLALLGLIGPCA